MSSQVIPVEAVEAANLQATEQWGDGMNFLYINRIRSGIKVRVERAGDGPWRRCITTASKESL